MDEDVRLREPNRQQLIMQTLDYEALIGAEHPARAIWRVLEGLDLSRFSAPLRARAHTVGRDATDPRVLLALWLYGLSEGVNSARAIARLSEAHAAYRWPFLHFGQAEHVGTVEFAGGRFREIQRGRNRFVIGYRCNRLQTRRAATHVLIPPCACIRKIKRTDSPKNVHGFQDKGKRLSAFVRKI